MKKITLIAALSILILAGCTKNQNTIKGKVTYKDASGFAYIADYATISLMSKEDKAKGKGERHRRTWEGKDGDDLVMFIDRLSLDDKKRLLSAIGSNDEATVDSMFDNFV